tara:strand:+ start:2966 stop:3562 length:597 start_codon:yes stop_codon:yes gene_type:complete
MTGFSKKSTKFGQSHILKENILYTGNWSEMVEFEYEDEESTVRKWEAMRRKNLTSAVIIVAQLKPSNRYILIRQFRPPTKSYLIEFPAGLVDPGEDIKSAALRELVEETGYHGEIEKQSPKLFSSPGILSETISYVTVSVDENYYKNEMPVTKQEPGEFITVYLKHPNEIKEFLEEESKQGVLFDAKLFTYFMAKGIL